MKFQKGHVYTIRRTDTEQYYHPRVWNHWQDKPKYLEYRSAASSMDSASRQYYSAPKSYNLTVKEFKQELTEVGVYEITI